MSTNQTSKTAVTASFDFGFAEQMRSADMGRFRNWYDRRCLFEGGAKIQVPGDETLYQGESGSTQRLAA